MVAGAETQIVAGDLVKCVRGIGPQDVSFYQPVIGKIYRVMKIIEDVRGKRYELIFDDGEVTRRFMCTPEVVEFHSKPYVPAQPQAAGPETQKDQPPIGGPSDSAPATQSNPYETKPTSGKTERQLSKAPRHASA